jgi:hypothetical protein
MLTQTHVLEGIWSEWRERKGIDAEKNSHIKNKKPGLTFKGEEDKTPLNSKSPSIPYYPSHPNSQTLYFLTTTLNLTAELSRECLSTHHFTPWGVLRRLVEIIGELFPMPMVSIITVPICDPLHRPSDTTLSLPSQVPSPVASGRG